MRPSDARRRRTLAFRCLLLVGLGTVCFARIHAGDPEPPAPLAPPLDPDLELAVTRLVPDARGPSWLEVEPGEPPPLDGLTLRGGALFERHCAPCHGGGGKGDGPLATELARRPRDLVRGKLRTRRSSGSASAADVFRTLTAGAEAFGMPSFAHLSVEDRWALVAAVTSRRGSLGPARPPVELPPRTGPIAPGRGAAVFERACASCHGATGDGRGLLAGSQLDELGLPCPPAAFALGPKAFRAGATAEAILATVTLGRPGTPMVPVALSPEDGWAVAEHVARLAREGLEGRRDAWREFLRRDSVAPAGSARVGPGEERWDPGISARFESAPPGARGCRACHEGIAPIASGRMALALDAFAGGDPDRACVVCHEGAPNAATKAAAHEGVVSNPGSLWVTSLGLGCGKCHAVRGSLTSLRGRRLPEATGGSLLDVISKATDPTGASGRGHAYRIQRALMAQETGKVYLYTASTGIVERGAPRYTDFEVDDPDGPTPAAGSAAYKAWVGGALRTGPLLRLERGHAFPLPAEAAATLSLSIAAASYLDVYRKDCGRCHLWSEGKLSDGERRSSGCSACHILNDPEHLSGGGDPTVPLDRPGHPLRHELVLAPPPEQCNHCHTRGTWARHDAHENAGMGCADCHTSIDVHGDGNLYASIRHQLEVRCEDCHGTSTAAPWELPLGTGTVAASSAPRGTAAIEGRQHLVTDRGNVRRNWLREGDQVVVESFATGRRHVARLLKDRGIAPATTSTCAAPTHLRVACDACHSGKGPTCGLCHVTYRAELEDQDHLLSALDRDPKSGRARVVLTPGKAVFQKPAEGTYFGPPEMRKDERGFERPQIPGCSVLYEHVDGAGRATQFAPRMNPGDESYPPPVAPTLVHEDSVPARTCRSCHVDGVSPSAPRKP